MNGGVFFFLLRCRSARGCCDGMDVGWWWDRVLVGMWAGRMPSFPRRCTRKAPLPSCDSLAGDRGSLLK